MNKLADPLTTTTESPGPTRRFRADIQALRAIAILAVLFNHLWPVRVPGGYVGVDVFFVISGYLITSHLVKEAAATGRIKLGAFYARRIRRLLPAALLVLAVSGLATALFLPYPRWERAGAEIIASATYVENWLLAALSVEYSALNDSATVAQHYWSLSVEEQFYMLWPLVILMCSVWAARHASNPRLVLTAALAVVGIVSLVSSAYVTAYDPTPAYFVTYARVWEFAAGGLVALLATRVRLSPLFRNALSMGGLAAIAFAVFLFNDQTPFPGLWALVPVLGTVAVILGGMSGRRQLHSFITSTAPVQWVGGISYALYLWHWPLIVLTPFIFVSSLTTAMKVGILVASLLLAWASKKFVEDTGQRWRTLTTSTPRTFGALAIGMALVAAIGGGLLIGHNVLRAENEIPPAVADGGLCVGPAAMDAAHACADPFGPAEDVVMQPRNHYGYAPSECGSVEDRLTYGATPTTVTCDFSNGAADAVRVWIVGDSQAQQWQGAIFDIARERGWHVTRSYYGGCPAVDVPFLGFRGEWGEEGATLCTTWSHDVADVITAEAPEYVFTSSYGREQLVDDGSDRPQMEQFSSGLVRLWNRWADAGSTVVALGGVPYNGEVRSADCVVLNPQDPLACAVPRDVAEKPDPYLVAATEAARPDVRGIDFTSSFCDAVLCYAVVGGLPVYYDGDHLNLEYTRLLAPLIAQTIDATPSETRSGAG